MRTFVSHASRPLQGGGDKAIETRPNDQHVVPSFYLITQISESLHYSGVGTVATVAALAATLFRPYINIHNLLS